VNMSDVATVEESQVLPVVAVVGRPNVGKSTLVNRMIGRREAVVQDVPGVTRDRVSYDATWNGRQFVLVDTGGWAPDAKGMAARVTEQAELAVAAADAVVLVVDATVGTQDIDEAVVKVLRRSGKPVILAANKVDDQRTEAEAAAMWQLGLGEPFPVSALHGRGSGDLLDAILAAIPEAPPAPPELEHGPRRVAIVGKPNVGKSSLLNKIAGQQRVVVDEVAGTTPQSQGEFRARVLREPTYAERHRARGGVRCRRRCQRATHGTGPPDPHICGGGRACAGDRVQQVGPD
jgi:GTP-binding protein